VVRSLQELPRTGVYVFPGRDADVPVRSIKRAFRAAVIRADIRRGGRLARVTPKTLRKCFATWHAQEGTRESVLQDLIGHARGSRVTRQYYEFASITQARAEAAKVWRLLSPADDEEAA
jgi:integrase